MGAGPQATSGRRVAAIGRTSSTSRPAPLGWSVDARPTTRGRARGRRARRSAPSAQARRAAAPAGAAAAAPLLTDWREFDLEPAAHRRDRRRDRHHRRQRPPAASPRVVALPGTADNSAIYLHGARVGGAVHDVAIVTTTYGITLAVDADSGRILWRFTPPGIARLAGQRADHDREPARPRRLRLRDLPRRPRPQAHARRRPRGAGLAGADHPGAEDREADRLAEHRRRRPARHDRRLLRRRAALHRPHRRDLRSATAPSSTSSTRSARTARMIIDPATCNASDSAILSRSGPVVEPGGDARPDRHRQRPVQRHDRLRRQRDRADAAAAWGCDRPTRRPTRRSLNTGDLDLGSGSPALLPGGLVLIGGKDALLRVLNLDALDGDPPGTPRRTPAASCRRCRPPGRRCCSARPRSGTGRCSSPTPAAPPPTRVAGRRLRLDWQNANHGTSPVLAGGLLYVYDMSTGGISVYDPSDGRQIAVLPTAAGHWNSPIVVDGHVIEPTGDANAHLTQRAARHLLAARLSRAGARRRPRRRARGRGARRSARPPRRASGPTRRPGCARPR